jgi:hypothetical protein
LGTHTDNSIDKVRKLRQARGSNHGSHTCPESRTRGLPKLTADDVSSIRASRLSTSALAAEHGVSRTLVRNIRNRRAWASLP